MKRLLLVIVTVSFILGSIAFNSCESNAIKTFPPPEGYSSWDEHNEEQFRESQQPSALSPTITPTPAPTSTSTPIQTPAPEPTPIKLLKLSGPFPLEHPIWDRGIGSISIGGKTVSNSTFLFIMGSATNIGTETLNSVICIMKCWNGANLIKTEEQVIGIVFVGDSFEFDIQTPDNPTVDNVTVEFKDSSGNIIPQSYN